LRLRSGSKHLAQAVGYSCRLASVLCMVEDCDCNCNHLEQPDLDCLCHDRTVMVGSHLRLDLLSGLAQQPGTLLVDMGYSLVQASILALAVIDVVPLEVLPH